MFDDSNFPEKSSFGKLFVFSLGLAYFATVTLDALVSLLLIDIASTFEVTLGVASRSNCNNVGKCANLANISNPTSAWNTESL
jgi:hypothetical protein